MKPSAFVMLALLVVQLVAAPFTVLVAAGDGCAGLCSCVVAAPAQAAPSCCGGHDGELPLPASQCVDRCCAEEKEAPAELPAEAPRSMTVPMPTMTGVLLPAAVAAPAANHDEALSASFRDARIAAVPTGQVWLSLHQVRHL